jgi:hypothetical protein
MGASKVMIIRHAEKPEGKYLGIDEFGKINSESLITLGWERAGGIANLFCPSNGNFQNPALAKPDFVYASDPAREKDSSKKPSRRPYETIHALTAKLNLPPITSFIDTDFSDMISAALLNTGTVLIAWQHQDILPKTPAADSIVSELLKQTQTVNLPGVPAGPWPGNRFDIVFVFDRPGGTGPFMRFTQVPQMLLAGDSNKPI